MLRKLRTENLDFVMAYGALVKLVGRDEADQIMLVLSHSQMTLEEKMEYLKDLVWCIKYERMEVALTVNPYLN